MDIFSRLNRKGIQDRQIDTLIGLSMGILADGRVDQGEAEFLHSWLARNSHSENPIVCNLLSRVELMLEDGVLDNSEAVELLGLLRAVTGEEVEFGEVAKTSLLPVCDPPPEVVLGGSTFLFTGTCAFGSRKECKAAVQELGGLVAENVTKKVNYLVLGAYVTDSWAHESFGRKIEKAMQYREAGIPISIISEEYWVDSMGV